MNPSHVKALLLRYIFLYSRNTFRVCDIFLWPIVELLLWGLTTMYLLKVSNAIPTFITFFLGAIIFWNLLYRAQQAVSVSILEEVWSRNFLNIFVAPVTLGEFLGATFVVGFIQCLFVLAITTVLALYFYSFNVLLVGIMLIPFFFNLLMMGWTLGLITSALVIRYGQAAEILAWALPVLVQPLSAVFYPVSILPPWLQPVALMVPGTHVFEGMRAILNGGQMPPTQLASAFILNFIYLALACLLFKTMFNAARKRGSLTKLGT